MNSVQFNNCLHPVRLIENNSKNKLSTFSAWQTNLRQLLTDEGLIDKNDQLNFEWELKELDYSYLRSIQGFFESSLLDFFLKRQKLLQIDTLEMEGEKVYEILNREFFIGFFAKPLKMRPALLEERIELPFQEELSSCRQVAGLQLSIKCQNLRKILNSVTTIPKKEMGENFIVLELAKTSVTIYEGDKPLLEGLSIKLNGFPLYKTSLVLPYAHSKEAMQLAVARFLNLQHEEKRVEKENLELAINSKEISKILKNLSLAKSTHLAFSLILKRMPLKTPFEKTPEMLTLCHEIALDAIAIKDVNAESFLQQAPAFLETLGARRKKLLAMQKELLNAAIQSLPAKLKLKSAAQLIKLDQNCFTLKPNLLMYVLNHAKEMKAYEELFLFYKETQDLIIKTPAWVAFWKDFNREMAAHCQLFFENVLSKWDRNKVTAQNLTFLRSLPKEAPEKIYPLEVKLIKKLYRCKDISLLIEGIHFCNSLLKEDPKRLEEVLPLYIISLKSVQKLNSKELLAGSLVECAKKSHDFESPTLALYWQLVLFELNSRESLFESMRCLMNMQNTFSKDEVELLSILKQQEANLSAGWSKIIKTSSSLPVRKAFLALLDKLKEKKSLTPKYSRLLKRVIYLIIKHEEVALDFPESRAALDLFIKNMGLYNREKKLQALLKHSIRIIFKLSLEAQGITQVELEKITKHLLNPKNKISEAENLLMEAIKNLSEFMFASHDLISSKVIYELFNFITVSVLKLLQLRPKMGQESYHLVDSYFQLYHQVLPVVEGNQMIVDSSIAIVRALLSDTVAKKNNPERIRVIYEMANLITPIDAKQIGVEAKLNLPVMCDTINRIVPGGNSGLEKALVYIERVADVVGPLEILSNLHNTCLSVIDTIKDRAAFSLIISLYKNLTKARLVSTYPGFLKLLYFVIKKEMRESTSFVNCGEYLIIKDQKAVFSAFNRYVSYLNVMLFMQQKISESKVEISIQDCLDDHRELTGLFFFLLSIYQYNPPDKAKLDIRKMFLGIQKVLIEPSFESAKEEQEERISLYDNFLDVARGAYVFDEDLCRELSLKSTLGMGLSLASIETKKFPLMTLMRSILQDDVAKFIEQYKTWDNKKRPINKVNFCALLCIHQSSKILKWLMKEDPSLIHSSPLPLKFALYSNNIELIELLVQSESFIQIEEQEYGPILIALSDLEEEALIKTITFFIKRLGPEKFVTICSRYFKEKTIEEDYSENGFEKGESTFLHHLLDRGKLKVLSFLLDNQVSIDLIDLKGNTVMHQLVSCSISEEQREKARANLMQYKPNLFLQNFNGDTPLSLAFKRKLKFAKALIEDKQHLMAQIRDRSLLKQLSSERFPNNLKPFLNILEKQFSKEEILKLLNNMDEAGMNPLLYACKGGNFGVVNSLLNFGVDPFVTNSDGDTALNLAITSLTIIRILLSKFSCPEVNLSDARFFEAISQRSPLTVACRNAAKNLLTFELVDGKPRQLKNEFHSIVTALLNYGIPVHFVDEKGCSALHAAVGCPESLFLKVKRHAEKQGVFSKIILKRDGEGNTLLHEAARNGLSERFKQILAWGIDPGLKNQKGETALQLAPGNSKKQILRILNRGY